MKKNQEAFKKYIILRSVIRMWLIFRPDMQLQNNLYIRCLMYKKWAPLSLTKVLWQSAVAHRKYDKATENGVLTLRRDT